MNVEVAGLPHSHGKETGSLFVVLWESRSDAIVFRLADVIRGRYLGAYQEEASPKRHIPKLERPIQTPKTVSTK